MNKTAIAVAAFIVLLIVAGYARGEDGTRISLGTTVINSHLKTGEIGYEWNSWEASATLLEAGDTKNGHQDQLAIGSLSYLTRPQGWDVWGVQPFLRLGVSYNNGSQLIGRTNYRLGLGLDFHDVWRVEFTHHSSAGIHDPNTGLDYVTLTYKAPAPW